MILWDIPITTSIMVVQPQPAMGSRHGGKLADYTNDACMNIFTADQKTEYAQ